MATIPAGPIAEKILQHLKIPTESPVPARARPAAQTELWDTGPPAGDEGPVPAPEDEFDQRRAESEFPA